MKISHVDLSDSDDLGVFYRAALAVHRHDRPDAPFVSEAEMSAFVRADSPSERFVPMLARADDDAVLGSALLVISLLDNFDKIYGDLSVLPEHRGQGVGDALMAEVLAVAENESRPVLILEGFFPIDADDTHPVRAFALRHGFSLANTEVRRTLRLPISEEVVRGWAEDAAPHHQGYELRTYENIVPADLRPSFVELLNQLAVDAPTGDIDFEESGVTVEVYEENSARSISAGRRLLITVAVKAGQAVAHSTLSIPPEGSELPHMNQWGTFVHRGHRGHRLGMAVKAANLLAVQASHPERTLIHTTNSPVNGPMVAINETIGFEPVEVFGEFMRTR